MNETRWLVTISLVCLGVASLIGASLACAAAAPTALRELAILDFRHALMHLEPGLRLLGVAIGSMIASLVCALMLDGLRTPPATHVPQPVPHAWSVMWRVRWSPLDVRMFKSGVPMQETVSQAEQRAVVSGWAHASRGASGATFAPGSGAVSPVSISLGERVPAFATAVLHHERVGVER